MLNINVNQSHIINTSKSAFMKKTLFILAALLISARLSSQTPEEYKSQQQQDLSISGLINVTNNGFSFIPAFTLDEPAAAAFVNIEKKRLTFSTEFRYALSGRPWALDFITRYKLLNTRKSQISIGMHFPSFSFVRTPVGTGTDQKQAIEAVQSFCPELNTSFALSESFSLGTTYMYYHAIGNDLPRSGHYFSVNPNFENIKLIKDLRLSAESQLFFLNIDGLNGFYFASDISVSKKDLPVSVSCMISKSIVSNIGGKDFNWNISLSYMFGRSYTGKKK
jgi:hypothetical protein